MENEVKTPTLKEKLQRDIALFGNLRALCLAAVLAAMSLILGKFLQIPNPLQQVVRISFENLPILLAGITMGPFIGGTVGVVADLLGCALYGYAINPIVTLGALAVGLLSGIVGRYVITRPLALKIAVATALAHLVGSVGVKSLGLAAWYLSSFQMGLAELMLWRLATYAIVATAEGVLLWLLLRRRAITSQMERMLNHDSR
ncbi:MAG: folate family ECF transporter S component [Clostridia bacterium]|nr:folate family ECF transporter S component [Clostridia bacterium]